METALRHPPVAGHPLLLLLAAAIVLSGCSKRGEIPIDGDDIAGVVTSTAGPEAGVWVIAETADLDTRFARIVVTDAQGRYLIPDLPPASYQVWVRGYGLTDSGKVSGKPGTRINLAAKVAPDAATAAQVYPAAYWYAMVKLPTEAETASLRHGRNEYLMWVKNMGCVGCHQLGQLSTRTLPPSLGKFNSSHDAWLRRISSGQAGNNMIQIAAGTLGGLPLKYLSDWTDRVALGELPTQKPARPQGIERNVVATVRDWLDEQHYLHDLSGTDRRNPTVNGYGPLYGSPELSTDDFPILDPRTNTATTFRAPVRDADTPTTHDDAVVAPSPYWADERIWDSKANSHNPMLDARGRVWYTARIRAAANPDFCRRGSDHPSAKVFPLERSGRQLAVYQPDTKQYTFVDTCYGTHHLQFAYDDPDDTLWTSGGGQVVGWLDTKKFDATGDAAASQGWSPHVLDTNGNGRRDDGWVEPGQPADAKRDTRIGAGFYAVMPSPADGSVWGTVAFQYPGAVLRFDPQTQLSEIYRPPLPGFGVRGADIDTQGVVWVSLGSGHLGEFDRRKCKAPLNGPEATGDHCPEGWTLHDLPGPGFADLPQFSVESSYYTWVDQHDTLGLGKDVPIVTGNLFDGVHARVGDTMVTLRIPYPLGFYMKGMEGRIDDADAGWKGRGLWVASGDRTPWLMETGKGSRPLVVHFQKRPDPLAK
ncbi:MAG: carboxypeptidase regulatory-like domain-containing protein [Pseudomonadota bacterium]|nr:carboxypeptidase regulatory-like domain-containing protein [Pseudomonadota bacterium]